MCLALSSCLFLFFIVIFRLLIFSSGYSLLFVFVYIFSSFFLWYCSFSLFGFPFRHLGSSFTLFPEFFAFFFMFSALYCNLLRYIAHSYAVVASFSCLYWFCINFRFLFSVFSAILSSVALYSSISYAVLVSFKLFVLILGYIAFSNAPLLSFMLYGFRSRYLAFLRYFVFFYVIVSCFPSFLKLHYSLPSSHHVLLLCSLIFHSSFPSLKLHCSLPSCCSSLLSYTSFLFFFFS